MGASISVASGRLSAEKIFELRSGDEEEQGLERLEGGLSVTQSREDTSKWSEAVTSNADG